MRNFSTFALAMVAMMLLTGCDGTPTDPNAGAQPLGAAPAAPAGTPPTASAPVGPVTGSLPLPPSTPTAPGTGKVICIDPGHPSETAAGCEANGATEVTVCWQVANKLKAQLEAQGLRVVMTKSAEREMVTNQRRAEIANEAGATLSIRIHAEDVPNQKGYRLYYPDQQGTHSSGKVGPSQGIITESGKAAQAVMSGMRQVLTMLNPLDIRGDSATAVGAKQGALTGSIFSTVPVVLCEMVVLRDPSDAQFILSEDGQNTMAKALATGIGEYLKVAPATPVQ